MVKGPRLGPRRHRALPAVALALSFAVFAAPATGEVTRVVVDRREIVLAGREWGEYGAYEKLVGRIFFAFDPRSPANARVADMSLAPTNADGRVEAWADFMVLQPVDPARRRGLAWLEVSNRGGKASLRYFQAASAGGWDPRTEDQFGDGLLMRQGLTIIWVGWQWDVPEEEGLLRLHVPTIRGGDGPIEGLARSDWTVEETTSELPLGHRGHKPYAPARLDDPDHVLTWRDGREAERTVVDRALWRFVEDSTGIVSGISLEGDFQAGRIYELVYRARDPRVVGLGLAAVRDMMSYAKYGLESEFPASQGIAFGVSQTGRFLRHFLYGGFNVDEGGRRVFDGMLIHTAGAGRGSFNHRFAQPSRDAHRYSAFFYPTDVFPFTSRPQEDPVTGLEEGLLDRTPEDAWPLVFYTNTGYEYWGRAASLIHTSTDGARDVLPMVNERVYHLAGGQHFVGSLPPPAEGDPEAGGPPVLRGNPLDFLMTLRALSIRLVEWVEDRAEPPPSAYPTVAQGTLVPPEAVAFPDLAGVGVPRVIHQAYRADYGPGFRSHGIVTRQPPALGPAFPSRVSQVDGFGNEMAGLRSFELRAPVATYYPWNLRGEGAAAQPGELTDFLGTWIPLPRTEEERRAWGDPRPSLEVLYGDRSAYMGRVVAAVQDLANAGLLLAEDAGRATARAAELWDWVMARPAGEGAPSRED